MYRYIHVLIVIIGGNHAVLATSIVLFHTVPSSVSLPRTISVLDVLPCLAFYYRVKVMFNLYWYRMYE